MEKSYWIILVIIAGAFLPIQAGFNSKIGKVLGSNIQASFVSFFIGTIGLLLFLLITKQFLNINAFGQVPKYTWTSGLLGAAYVVIAISGFQKLGAPLTFGMIVTGQLFMSIFLEHNKILVDTQSSFNTLKFLGVLLVLSGVALIKYN